MTRPKLCRPRVAWFALAALFACRATARGPAAGAPVSPAAVSALPPTEPGRTLVLRDHLRGVRLQNPTFAVMTARGPRIWFVGEREGRVLAVPEPGAAATTVVDLRAHTLGWQDTGLLNLVLHPEFGQAGSPNRGFLYVWYNHTDKPHPGPDQPFLGHLSSNRLSRFTVPDGSLRADPASELVLIEQPRNNTDHQGGGMFFHPDDGFLYVAVGDGGHPYVASRGVWFTTGTDDPQRIDRNLLSGVLRIDVDRRGGDKSHPIRRQPRDGRTQGYFIPSDNPWVSPRGDVLEEFFAIGLRSPHRMSHDPGSGRIFVGDVGEGRVEEVDVIERGANYQWSFLEGALPYAARPARILGTERPPLFAWQRAGRFSSVIGGVTYRGRALPQLAGRYLFGDNGNGQIYSVDARAAAPAPATEVLRLPAEAIAYAGLASFAVDREGEVYLVVLGQNDQQTGSLQKLEPAAAGPAAPATLAETGLFSDLTTLAPRAGGFAYQVNAPFWSDHKQKARWLHVPTGARIGFRADGEWDFPPGTVAVKHFDLALDERDARRTRRLETRVLVMDAEGGAYGRTYKWRSDGQNADLLHAPVTEVLTAVAREPWGPLQAISLDGDGGDIEAVGGGLRLRSGSGTFFAFTDAAGDFDVGVHVSRVAGGGAGLLLRSTSGSARAATLPLTGASGWLRLARVSGVVRGYTSDDGQLWRAVADFERNVPGTQVGVFLRGERGPKRGPVTAEIDTHVRLVARDHYYPSGDECMACHTKSAHYVLGATTRQWNRPGAGGENQLVAASHAGLLDRAITASEPAAWKRLVPADDAHASLEDRVRSYLDANCAHCHRPGVLAQIGMDLRYDTPLAKQGLVRGLVRWPNVPAPNELIVIPKDLDRSRLYQRVRGHRMPPLGSLLVNQQGVDLLEQWIMSLEGPPVLREVQISALPSRERDRQRVELRAPDPDVAIHYTVDGSGPSRETPRYTAPFEVAGRTVVRAIAVKAGFVDSKLVSRNLGR